VGALGHFVEHGADLLPFRVELFELRWADVASVDGVIQPRLRFRGFAERVVTLLTNAASYRRFAQASAIIAFTARDERLI
jgi:hypothetical protein